MGSCAGSHICIKSDCRRYMPALQHGDHRRLLRFGTAGFGGLPPSLGGPLAGSRGSARSPAGLALGSMVGLAGLGGAGLAVALISDGG
jgi:hypothetical protein